MPVDELRPWHYDDPFFQSAPAADDLDLDPWFADGDQIALTRATYAGIGLDVDAVLARSDLLPAAGQEPARVLHRRRPRVDVRVLCNNVPGEYWTETMLHEFGHAVYDLHVDPDLPWLVRTMHPLTTEGIAMLFGRLTLDAEWLDRRRRRRRRTRSTRSPRLWRAAASPRCSSFARWVLVMTNFERGLYADPDADHDTAWWDLVERFQLLHPPRRPPRARLGREDPRGARARLLPELPAR